LQSKNLKNRFFEGHWIHNSLNAIEDDKRSIFTMTKKLASVFCNDPTWQKNKIQIQVDDDMGNISHTMKL